jgi:hypothetical protein
MKSRSGNGKKFGAAQKTESQRSRITGAKLHGAAAIIEVPKAIGPIGPSVVASLTSFSVARHRGI